MFNYIKNSKIISILSIILAVAVVVSFMPQKSVEANDNIVFPRGDLEQIKCYDVDLSELEGDTGLVEEMNLYAASGEDYWSKYSSTYYRNVLKGDRAKLYDGMYNMCMSWLTTKKNISYQTDRSIYVDTYGLSQEQVKSIFTLVANSNPQFYFLDIGIYFGYMGGKTYMSPVVFSQYLNGSARMTETSRVKSKLDALSSKVAKVNGEYEIAKKAYQVVAETLVYDATAYSNSDTLRRHQSIVTAIFAGKSVCAGYSELYEALCEANGVSCITVTSTYHEWNQIKINGVWYNADVTWDDRGDTAHWDNFCLSDTKFKAKGGNDHTPEAFYSTLRPVCSYDYDGTTAQKDSASQNTKTKQSNTYVYKGIDYSLVFDPVYYLKNNKKALKNVAKDNKSLFKHFTKTGMKKGLRAKKKFDPVSYRMEYSDLRKSYGNKWEKYYKHYITKGYKEKRHGSGCNKLKGYLTKYKGVDYSSVYDYNYYVKKYPSIKKKYGLDDKAVLKYFVQKGMKKGHVASSKFNVKKYKSRYSDLKKKYENNLKSYYLHYIKKGKKEGRKGK